MTWCLVKQDMHHHGMVFKQDMFLWNSAWLSEGHVFMAWCLVTQETCLHGVVLN
jgi:hypothetical protein